MSLVAWYPLNGNLNDYSGNDNHLVHINNTGKIVVSNEGKIGKCFRRIVLNDGPDVLRSTKKVSLLSGATLSCWAKVSDVHSGTANGLVTNHNHSNNTGLGITVKEISSSDYRISCNTGSGTSRTFNSYYGTTNIKDKWCHLVVRFQKENNAVSLWVDGTKEMEFGYNQLNEESYIDLFNWSTTFSDTAMYRPASSLNDVRIYDHAISDRDLIELAKAKVVHYTFEQPVQPHVNLAKDEMLAIYNNAGSTACPSTLTDTGRTFEGAKIYRLTMTPNDTAINTYGFRTTLGSHGVIINTRTFTSLKKYTASVLWKPVSHFDVVFGGNAQNAPAYWKIGSNRQLNEGWTEYHQYLDGSSNTLDKTNQVFFSFYVPSLKSGESIVIDVCCPRIIEGVTEPPKTPYYDDVNSKVVDMSGFGNDGLLSPSTSPIWSSSEQKMGVASYFFNGERRYIESFDDTLPSLTVSGWIKFTSSSTWMLLSKSRAGVPGAYYIFGDSVSHAIFSMFGPTGTRYDVSFGPLEGVGFWYHFAATFDATTGLLKAYKNGNLVSTTTGASLGATNSKLLIGNYESPGYNTNGYIDDVRVYAQALSPEDIKSIYQRRAHLDNQGVLNVYHVDSKSYIPTLTDYSSWKVGISGDQSSFILNGTSSENRIVIDENPCGDKDVVWECSNNDTVSDGDGGWSTTPFPIDRTKLYRYSIWVRKKVIGNGYSYVGCLGNSVYNVTSNTVDSNPYFYVSTITDTDWRLFVSYILPYDTTHTSTVYEDSGVYDMNGNKIGETTCFKWSPTATSGTHRAYLYYSTDPSTVQHFYRPRVEIVDGFEPTLEQLLRCNEHRPLIGNAGEYNHNLYRMNEKGIIHTGEIYEVGMPIRYIRDWINGSNVNTGNHWVEIEAFDLNGKNIALGKSATHSILTDGVTETTPYYSANSGLQSVQVDLGDIHTVTSVNVRHYYGDGRTYNSSKTEVSADGLEWSVIYDSNISGVYQETPEGKEIICRPQKMSVDRNGNLFINELKEVTN